MDLADALEPAQELGGVGIDPDDLGGLVGHADFDQLVELLVDAALEQIDQPLPGDIGAAAAAQLLDLAELIERALELLPDLRQACELGGFGLAFVVADDGELSLGQGLERREIGIDHLVQIGGAQGTVGHSGQQRVGPGLEQLLAMAGELELPLELLMGDARARQIAMRPGHAPIGERCRGKRHGQQQSGGDEELRLVTHRKSLAARPAANWKRVLRSAGRAEPL